MNTVTSSSFGLFVKKSFLDADLCASIRAEMSSAGGGPSSVVRSDERLLDEKYRTHCDERGVGRNARSSPKSCQVRKPSSKPISA
jgi:hypothetical protein